MDRGPKDLKALDSLGPNNIWTVSFSIIASLYIYIFFFSEPHVYMFVDGRKSYCVFCTVHDLP